MTTHHSGWCTSCGKYFPVPSTSRAGRSEKGRRKKKNKNKTPIPLMQKHFFYCYDCATYAAFGDVVGVVHDVSGQTEVTDLD